MAEAITKRERRQRKTRRSVRVVEGVARTLISIGGVATILAVGLICVFLVWVVVPLFRGADVSAAAALEPGAATNGKPLHTRVDEYRQMACTVFGDGTLEVSRLDTGARLSTRSLFDGVAPTCSAFAIDSPDVAFGFANGDIRIGAISFSTRYLADAAADERVRSLKVGERAELDGGIVERTPEGQLRAQQVSVELGAPVRASPAGSGIELIDLTMLSNGPVVCVLASDGALTINSVHKTQNLMTGEETTTLSSGVLPYRPQPIAPRFLALFGNGDNVALAWADGTLVRFDARNFDAPREVEQVDLVPKPGAELTALRFLVGKKTLVSGDSLGNVRAWFRTKPEGATTSDGSTLVCAHQLDSARAAVTAFGPSPASRALAVGYADGQISLFHVTSEKQLGASRARTATAIAELAFAPRQDAVVAYTANGLERWDTELRHPEANVASLLAPVWYEDYAAPAHVWQSSRGNDLEPKLGLMPLIFGTLKATFYSMLFGVPVALLAAIFSSEFLHPRLRVGLKSLIEIMASLPSVVLGFLAAIVVAPFVQHSLPAVLTTFFVLPVTLVLGAHVWQQLPHKLTLRLEGWQRFAVICAMIPLGVMIAISLAPVVERVLFAGDIQHWLDGRQRGGPIGGWMLLLLPVSAVVTMFVFNRFVNPWVSRISRAWSRPRCARVDLLRFLAAAAATIALALGLSASLGAMHFDPRGSYVDTYVQRNALVVGVLMGFAIIPLIYTLAEDALTSVPQHLRLASLGAGATQWQTAVRVIIPTAASGLFSAVMIGLGRAVGETMIVLMAAGNTAVMDWNVFSGFRTLSANIAVELPEAIRNDTHYRTLFLAALALFAMTLLVNTAAELVRQRFRKRAFQL